MSTAASARCLSLTLSLSLSLTLALIEVRACVVHRRPWWALPLAAQYAAAPRPTEHPP